MTADVDILRRAASLMRSKAKRMPQGRYGMTSSWTTPTTMLSKVTSKGRVIVESRQNAEPYDGVYAADYFATLHPDFALEVAALLELLGAWIDEGVGLLPNTNVADAWRDIQVATVTVARAFLREDA